MERWAGKVAVVTGASSGIGYEIVRALADRRMVVVGLARRVENVKELAETITKGTLHAVKCDLTKDSDIIGAFEWIEANLGGVDLMVNNAGVMRLISLIDMSHGSSEDTRATLDTNVTALTLCTREALRTMRQRGDNGHVIHLSSTAGHEIIPMVNCGVYSASKHAVQALAKALRFDLSAAGSKIKVTTICPGLVHTEMPRKTMMQAFNQDIGSSTEGKRPETYLSAKDVAETVLNVISMQPYVQIEDIIMKAL